MDDHDQTRGPGLKGEAAASAPGVRQCAVLAPGGDRQGAELLAQARGQEAVALFSSIFFPKSGSRAILSTMDAMDIRSAQEATATPRAGGRSGRGPALFGRSSAQPLFFFANSSPTH